jgi:hypothetical protein
VAGPQAWVGGWDVLVLSSSAQPRASNKVLEALIFVVAPVITQCQTYCAGSQACRDVYTIIYYRGREEEVLFITNLMKKDIDDMLEVRNGAYIYVNSVAMIGFLAYS